MKIRPGLDKFLENISKIAQIVAFTAAEKEYADQILEHIDPFGRFFQNVFYRDSLNDGKKDISIIGTPLYKTILIDDSAANFIFQPMNGIQILPYFGSPYDNNLRHIWNIVRCASKVHDVRQYIKGLHKNAHQINRSTN